VDDRLLLDWRGRRTGSAPLQAVGEHHYYADLPGGGPGAYVGFVPESKGPTRYLLLNGGWCRRTDGDRRGSGEPPTM
jgi:hypothetical protein